MTLRPPTTIQKALLSTTSHFVGHYEDEGVLLTHAWPEFRDASGMDRWSEGPSSRQAFVFAFKTPPFETMPGMPVPDYSGAGAVMSSCLSVLFGKRFDSHGLTEGSGLFHVPDLSQFGALCNHRVPYNSHSARVDLDVPLNLTEVFRIERIIRDDPTLDARFRSTFRGAAKFYLQALQVAEVDAEVGYLHLITAAEVLSNFYDFPIDQLLDERTREILSDIRLGPNGTRNATFVAGRLRQVKRRFLEAVIGLVDADFFERSESGEPACRLKAASFRDAISSAYDLRSKYVHSGVPFGKWISFGMGSTNFEVQLGRPVVGDNELGGILHKAPTFVGLERVLRYCLLRCAQAHGAYTVRGCESLARTQAPE